uniref:Uncharacterized protein n=1 Tax=Meloidogyne enterolobii TaxID=390850 RepID=A0A6V7XSH6_MELEN|nr:unnamed protein product [Meloidogyne enterolobii]
MISTSISLFIHIQKMDLNYGNGFLTCVNNGCSNKMCEKNFNCSLL